MTAIIDYDAGNIKSVENALRFLGHDVVVTSDPGTILRADHVILPGVGAFGDAMQRIRGLGLEDTIQEVVRRGTPFLGICLGLQLFFEESVLTETGARFRRSDGMICLSQEKAVSLQDLKRGPMSILYTLIISRRVIPMM